MVPWFATHPLLHSLSISSPAWRSGAATGTCTVENARELAMGANAEGRVMGRPEVDKHPVGLAMVEGGEHPLSGSHCL
jgi:hypothetical protein